MAAALNSMHGNMGAGYAQMKPGKNRRRELQKMFARQRGPEVLNSIAKDIHASASRCAYGIIEDGARWMAEHGVPVGFLQYKPQLHAGMTAAQRILGLDFAYYYGPKCIPAIARHSWRGRDGRTLLRRLTGRYLTLGSMDHSSERSLREDMGLAEATQPPSAIRWTCTEQGRSLWVSEVNAYAIDQRLPEKDRRDLAKSLMVQLG